MTMSEAWPRGRRRPSQPRPDEARTRDTILRAAASLATVNGLDGLSIGRLAAALGISKSSLHVHFASKTELQLATVAEAARVFEAEVVQPALAASAGLGQLTAMCEAFFEHLERHTFPGGSILASVALEIGALPAPVKDLIASFQSQFGDLIRGFAAAALAGNELPADEDPDRLAFELNGILLATDTNFLLHDDPAVLDLARQIVHQRLGVSPA
jgi:AcrR family transcriptional regulator